MAGRKDLVRAMQHLFGPDWFVYGGYRNRPDHFPHAIYIESPRLYTYADNKSIKIRCYIIRVVTEDKDFDLEDQVEDTFDDLEIAYQKITDEPFADEKCHVVEWELELIEPPKVQNG